MKTNLKIGDQLHSTVSNMNFELTEIGESYSFDWCINQDDRERRYFNVRYKDINGNTYSYNGLTEGENHSHSSFIW